MAGVTKRLKAGEVLFKSGDASDGMYIVRSGELVVYLEKDNKEMNLAKVGAGSMIGEMSLFDAKPRSASVKAGAPTEVTYISNDDFKKLVKQIPKWFVGLMATLSTRLRDTNTRLQKIEQGAGKCPYDNTLKVLNVLSLIFRTNAIKEKKLWLVNRKETQEIICEMYPEIDSIIPEIIDELTKAKFFTLEKDSYNNPSLAIQNRGVFSKLLNFINVLIKEIPENPFLPPGTMEFLNVVNEMVAGSVYDSITIDFDEACEEGQKKGMETDSWKMILPYIKKTSDTVKLVKTSSGGLGIRTQKKEFAEFFTLQKHVNTVTQIRK